MPQKNIEKEVKFRINSKISTSQLEDFLKLLGLTKIKSISQKDVYWDNQDCEIINLKRGLRVRYVSNVVKDIEFKSLFMKNTGDYVIEEIKLLKNSKLDISSLKNILVSRLGVCALEDFNGFSSKFPETGLIQLSFYPIVTLEKERAVWVDNKNETEVSLDIVSSLGIFIEVEQKGDSSQIFEKIVKKFEESSFANRDTTHSGYLDLILNKNGKITSKAGFEKKFRLDNMWNVRPGEKDIYRSLTN